ncbi:28S rRNA (cytosine-C(5))-methyltransferase [Armigeres subalbatus]|uniref:28S rRNA (cytosine-C(5))-methyltransferase n=1 Tax=Armigeres subalbatus TaxID=124917 RepID=UPI002ED2B3FA
MAVDTEKDSQQDQPRRHKIPVPSNYRTASKILRRVVEERCNVKTLILEEKHIRKGKGLAIMDLILVNLKQIDELLKRTNLLTKEPRLNPWLAKVLIAELIFGRGELNGDSLPVQCIKRYKEELQATLGELDVAPTKQLDFKEPRYIRINTSVLAQPGAIRLLQEEGWMLVEEEFEKYADFLERVKNLGDSEFIVDFHFKEVLVFPNSAKNYWARATELKQKFVLQNKACIIPTYLLNPPKKSVVLDMCAAPGLKTTHLANLMKNKGRIYAVERDANRYKLLCDYSADFGVIKTINDDCMLVGDEQAPGVEYILLDPSCSGSGMVSRLKLNEEYDKQRLYRLGGLQYKLLCHAMNAFPSVKRIVYSTCSIFPEENEDIVQGALKHNGHFKLTDAKEQLGKEWHNFGSPDYPGIGEKCLYARSETDLTIGMFVAVFERCNEDEYNEVYLAHEKQKESYEKLSKMGQGMDFGRGKKGKGKKKTQPHEEEFLEQTDVINDTTLELDQLLADHNDDFPNKKARDNGLEEASKTVEHAHVETDSTGIITEKKNKSKEAVKDNTNEPDAEVKKTKKKKKKTQPDGEEESLELTDVANNVSSKLDQLPADHYDVHLKKKKKTRDNYLDEVNTTVEQAAVETDSIDISTKKKKKSKKAAADEESGTNEPDVKPKKTKKKKRKHDTEQEVDEESLQHSEPDTDEAPKKKKKKKKMDQCENE